MKQIKKILITFLPYIITSLIIILTFFLIIELNTNHSKDKLLHRDIEKITFNKKIDTNTRIGLIESKIKDKYFYLGYINSLNNDEGIITLDENSELFFETKTSFIWKIKIYINKDEIDENSIIFNIKTTTRNQQIKPILEKDKQGYYLYFDIMTVFTFDTQCNFIFTKKVNILSIDIYSAEIKNELPSYQFELNSDNTSYRITKLNSKKIINSKNEEVEYTIIPDTFKGLPVTDYELNDFNPAGYVKIGKNIEKIYSRSFGSTVKYVEFSEEGNLSEIQSSAFDNTSLETIYIPSYIKTIDPSFIYYKTTNIVKVIFEGKRSFPKFSNMTLYYDNIKKDQVLYIDKMTYIINNDYVTLIDIDNDLQNINIPNIINNKYPVTEIEDYILYKIDDITSITLPDNTTCIKSLFYNNEVKTNHISKVNEYQNGLYIGSNTNKYIYLLDCKNAETITLHSDLKYIHPSATDRVTVSKQLLENGCVYISSDSNPYYWCIKIGYNDYKTKYEINENTRIISDLYLLRTAEIVLPKNLEKIITWEGKGNITFSIDSNNQYYATYYGSIYEKLDDGYALIYASGKSIINNEFLVIDNCKIIRNYAMSNLSFEKLNLPETLETIEDHALNNVIFTRLYIPASLQYVGNLLDYLYFPLVNNKVIINPDNKIFTIENEMLLSADYKILYKEFSDDNTFEVPYYVEYIKYAAINARNIFIHNTVKEMEDFYLNAEHVFFDGTEEEWKQYSVTSKKIYFNGEYTTEKGVIYAIIDNNVWAVSYDDSIRLITLSSEIMIKEKVYNLFAIGPYAFNKAKLPTKIIIPHGVDTISSNAFNGIINMNNYDEFKLFIPLTVTKMGTNIINYLHSDKKITVYCQATSKLEGWNSYCFSGVDEVYYNMSSIPE